MSTGTTLTPAGRRVLGEEDTQRALTALVLAGGSYESASRALAEQDFDISRQRLYDLRARNTERYENLRVELSGTVAQRIASEAESIAVQTAQVELSILESMDDEIISKLSPKERADTLRSLATSKALQIDKVASPLRGRPSVITERRDPDQILRQLESLLGTAEDVPTEALTDESGPVNPRELNAGTTQTTV